MPLPGQSSVLSKCATTLTCYLRAAPLWAIAILFLLLASVRQLNLLSKLSKPSSEARDRRSESARNRSDTHGKCITSR